MAARRNPMLREAGGLEQPAPRLQGEHRADLCIVGGGYLGLWTALEARAAEPSLEISVLEADICGGGASGRNSGMALPWWTKIEPLVASCGTDDGLMLARASADAIDEIAAFAHDNDLDIEFARTGWLWGATCARQEGRWTGVVEALARHGAAPFRLLDRGGVDALLDAPGLRAGAFDPGCATLQPARLARGLRRVALSRGIAIFENSAMTRLRPGRVPVVETEAGRVVAPRVALAMNAWSTAMPALSRGVFVLTSDDALSDPAPEVLAARRWAAGPIVTDGSVFVSGFRPTRDGRIVGGVTGGHIPFGPLAGRRFEGRTPREGDIAAAFDRSFGTGHGVRFVESWRRPIDRTRSGLPLFGPLPGHPGVSYGYGFSGTSLIYDAPGRCAYFYALYPVDWASRQGVEEP